MLYKKAKTFNKRRLLRVPWTTRSLSQSILNEINREYSLEGLMLKVKLQYFGHLRQRAYSLEKTLMLGKTKGRRREQQRMRWLDGITDSMDMSLSKRKLVMNSPWGCKESDTTQQLNNTTSCFIRLALYLETAPFILDKQDGLGCSQQGESRVCCTSCRQWAAVLKTWWNYHGLPSSQCLLKCWKEY